jgi:hypothetical protein
MMNMAVSSARPKSTSSEIAGCRWLQRDGKSMEEVSILLGHSSVLVTEQRYAFLETIAASLSGRTRTRTSDAAVIPITKRPQ